MKLFDDLIEESLSLIDGEKLRRWSGEPSRAAAEGAPNELILRRDMAFELGEGSYPSVNVTAITQDEALVPENGVALWGADLGEIRTDCAFARLTFLRTDNIYEHGDQAAYNLIKSLENRKFHVSAAGYMMRPSAMSSREQVRVSKRAIKEGLSFEKVGSLLIKKYRENPHVQAVYILFITQPDAPYGRFDSIAGRIASVSKTLNHALADVSMDCRACEWKPVCDAVDGMKELHQKQIENKEESK